MSFPEKTVFTLVCQATQMRHDVRLWEDYGVVCTTLWTTNGSFGYFSEICSGHVSCGSYTVEESALDSGLDFTNQRALAAALREVYLEWKATLGAGQ